MSMGATTIRIVRTKPEGTNTFMSILHKVEKSIFVFNIIHIHNQYSNITIWRILINVFVLSGLFLTMFIFAAPVLEFIIKLRFATNVVIINNYRRWWIIYLKLAMADSYAKLI